MRESIPLNPPVDLFGDDPFTTIVVTKYDDGNAAIYCLAESGDRGRISMNLPEAADRLDENEYFVKNYAEGEQLYAVLVQRGILVPTGQSVHSGYVRLPICRFNKEKCSVPSIEVPSF